MQFDQANKLIKLIDLPINGSVNVKWKIFI
jgi:hypothetical protein